jgi:MFS family permease
MAALLAMLRYLDRACIAVMADDIRSALSLTRAQMEYVFSSFALAYAVFEIPTAWWVDRVGTRSVLTRIVVWWSAFTMATGAASWAFIDPRRPVFEGGSPASRA